ncbi:MAG: tetratricopeptide repeat protein [Acidobacteriota bacterium]|nr:tetratricopeptide repeat protein [Acidobacteriota bacterium]
MKRIFFITLFLSLSSVFVLNCKSADEPNANTASNQTANTISAANQTAADANKLPETVPTFGDAAEAVAAGDKYLDAIETENAIDAFKQAVKLNPDFAEAYFKLGIAHTLREKEEYNSPGLSKEEPTPTPKKGKKDVPVLSDSEKAFENAAKVYEKFLKKNPKDDQAKYNLGRAYNKLNKDKEAEKALREAVKLKPDDAEYQTEFGSILIKLAQYDEAVTVLNKAVKLDDGNLQAQDLLERAEAGKKRINFGIKPKPPQQREEISRPRTGRPKPKSTPKPAEQTVAKPEPTQ